MAPLIVLVGSFLVINLFGLLFKGFRSSVEKSGQISVMIMFVFTGISHFFFTNAMIQMLPAWVPEREILIYMTGILEIVGGIAILIPRLMPLAGISLILFLFSVLPSNVYAAMNYTGLGGHVDGPSYLIFRVPLQLFFIAWTWFFVLRKHEVRGR